MDRISGIKFSIGHEDSINIEILEKSNLYVTEQNNTLNIDKDGLNGCFKSISNVDLEKFGF